MKPIGDIIRTGGSIPNPERIEHEKRSQMEAINRIRKMLKKRPGRVSPNQSMSWARGIVMEDEPEAA